MSDYVKSEIKRLRNQSDDFFNKEVIAKLNEISEENFKKWLPKIELLAKLIASDHSACEYAIGEDYEIIMDFIRVSGDFIFVSHNLGGGDTPYNKDGYTIDQVDEDEQDEFETVSGYLMTHFSFNIKDGEFYDGDGKFKLPNFKGTETLDTLVKNGKISAFYMLESNIGAYGQTEY